MSQTFEIQGIVHSIGATTEYGNNGFTKREFVIKLTGEDENPAYPNHVALELIKDKCALMDNHQIGDELKVSFNLSGRLWSGNGKPEKCFTSLQAWRIEPLGATPSPTPYAEPQPTPEAFAPAPSQAAPQTTAPQSTTPATNSFNSSFDDDIPF